MSRAERAREALNAFELGDYLDSLPRIEVTDDILHRVPIHTAGWHWSCVMDGRRYWAAEAPIAAAVAKTLGVTLLPAPSNKKLTDPR